MISLFESSKELHKIKLHQVVNEIHVILYTDINVYEEIIFQILAMRSLFTVKL